ncbi:MAG: rod shape-determining protein [Bacteroidales bacterium]|jgi:rod shape-determining protein MreB|nr:rod shape-determining protein [Bacteroidales bacterium]MBR5831950.1 rod shape-determining protein [Bacteroidales bacterium]
MGLFSLFNAEIAMDLGTANSIVIHNDQIVIDEPSIVAVNKITNKIEAVGKKAQQMQGRENRNIETIRPLRDGVIADFEMAQHLIREFIKMTNATRSILPPALRMVICIPSGITNVEERAVRESAEQAGAKEIRMIHEPMAAAIGIGIDVLEPVGHMVVDIGGGTAEIAVISLGGIVCNKSVRVAGDDFNDNICEYMKKQHNMIIGERTAERVKMEVGSAVSDLANPPEDFPTLGRDIVTGIPIEKYVNYKEIAHALDKSIARIETAVMEALAETPPELAADIYKTGIYLAGGGSLLRGLDARISAKTKLQVHVAEDPLRAVARGTATALKNFNKFHFLIK